MRTLKFVRFIRLLAPDRDACVYAITCREGLTKIGVAADPRERLRAMQVGSPLPLELGWFQPFPRAEDSSSRSSPARERSSASACRPRSSSSTSAAFRLPPPASPRAWALA